jgi:hypothetical protein
MCGEESGVQVLQAPQYVELILPGVACVIAGIIGLQAAVTTAEQQREQLQEARMLDLLP